MSRNIKSIDNWRIKSGHPIQPTTTVSGGSCSGGIDFYEDRIRISMRGTAIGDAVSCVVPFAFDITKITAIAKTTIADAAFDVQNGSTIIAGPTKVETADTQLDVTGIDESATAFASGDTLKLYATSSGGEVIYLIDFVPALGGPTIT